MTASGFILAYVCLSVIDLVTTLIGLGQGHVEVNPFAAWFYRMWGEGGVIVYKTVTVTAISNLVAPYWHKEGVRWLAYIGLVLLLLVCISNIVVVSQ